MRTGSSRGRMRTVRIRPTTSERGERENGCLYASKLHACMCKYARTPLLSSGPAFWPLLSPCKHPIWVSIFLLLQVLLQAPLPAFLLLKGCGTFSMLIKIGAELIFPFHFRFPLYLDLLFTWLTFPVPYPLSSAGLCPW